MRTHGIVQLYPAVWVIPLSIICIYAIKAFLNLDRTSKKFLIKQSKWIIYGVIVLLLHISFDHGNSRLTNTFNYLLISAPFYLLGFKYGYSNQEYSVRNITIAYYIFLSIFLMQKSYFVINTGNLNSSIMNSLFVNSLEDRDIILFWPFAAFVTIVGYYYMRQTRHILLKICALIFAFTNIIAFILSGKAAPIVLMMFALIFFYLYKYNLSIKQIFKLFVPLSFVIATIMIIGTQYYENLGSLGSKSAAIVSIFREGLKVDRFMLDQISSARYTAAIYSIQQFIKAPILGGGGYGESVVGMLGSVDKFTTVSGNHSYFLDTLAFYGVTGIPLLMINLKFINHGFQYIKRARLDRETKKIALIYTAFMSAAYLSNIVNTFYLYSPFDQFIFLIAGLYLGKYYLSIRQREINIVES